MELAILESVGMTDRQRNRLLVMEGLIFAAGLPADYWNRRGSGDLCGLSVHELHAGAFCGAVWPIVGMTAFIAAVCVIIPLTAGALMVRRGSVMERVRGV